MKSLTILLTTVRDELNKIEEEEERKIFYHYRRPSDVKSNYGVWHELGEKDSHSSDNKKQEQQIQGYLDYYTLVEYDPVIDMIQEALNNLNCGGWTLNSVQYEDETNLIHYEWYFTVV